MADPALYDALRKADAAGDTEGAAKLAAYIKAQGAAPAAKAAPAKPKSNVGYGLTDLATSKMTFGISDRVTAAADALLSGKSYTEAQADTDRQKEAYKAAHPIADWATLPLNFIGGGAGKVAQVGKSIYAAAAKEGAKYGFLSGVGNARGSAGEQATQIAGSTALGAAAAPIAAKVVPIAIAAGDKYAVKPLIKLSQMVRKQPELAKDAVSEGIQNAPSPTKAARIIAKALAAQGTTPRQAGQMIAGAKAKGVPLALMDTGDEARGLASSLSRKPGDNRTIMRDAVISRQEGQTERVQGAIKRDLGPTANVRDASEKMMKGASDEADPLYEKAYANPIPETEKLQDLARRPSMRDALKRAYRIAAEEGRDPKVMGFTLDKEGNVALEKHNSTQTWDYVKRGLDDVIESHRDPVTNRLKLDESLRAINGTQREFLKEIDRVNPDYAAARAAYAGPAKMTTALNKGAKIGTKDSETIQAETRDLSAPEIEQYKLGVRSALSKMLEGRVDGADKVRALVGTPKKRAALTQLFGGEDKFGNFLATLAHEARTSATHARINTGSPTASNLADDATLDGLGGVAAKAGERAILGHGIVGNAVRTIGDLARYGTGKAAQRLRTELSVGLSETDPVMLADLIRRASRENAGKRLGARKAAKVAPIAAAGAGITAGKTLGMLGGGN